MSIFNILNLESQELSINEITPFFGVEVFGLPRVRRISEAHIEKIKNLITEHGLVILRNKASWTEVEQVTFTKRLGDLDTPIIYSTTTPSDPKVLKMWPNAQQSGLQWHSDRSFMKRPAYLSVFQMVERPTIGNETSFLSLSNVCENLDDNLKKKWANYQIVYAIEKNMHPLFWTHPYNGRKTMYFDFRFAEEIVDICSTNKHMEIRDINEVMQVINQAFSEEKAKYTHIWKKNDVVIADNYAISHKANITSESEESRVLIRSSTKGIYF